jgi:hypothetical protein
MMLRVAVKGFHFTNDVALLFEQISFFVSRADKKRKVQEQQEVEKRFHRSVYKWYL